ncbi:MAG: hypothetical protein AN485_24290, partial [Anabaena sp. MDT14b]
DLTRTLNNLFSMGSMQANVLNNMNAFGPPTFVVDGGPVQRCVSHLDCPEGQQPLYCLRYIHDSSHAQLEARVAMLEARTAQVNQNGGGAQGILAPLQEMLERDNPWVQLFVTVGEFIRNQATPFKLVFARPGDEGHRRLA